MAVSTTNAYSGPYTANGVTTVFPFTFTAPTDEEVTVVLVDADGAETTVNPGNYSVTISESGGGSVTFDAAPDGTDVVIYLDPLFTQDIEFENGSAWLAAPVNEANDRAAARDQYLKARVDRLSPPGLLQGTSVGGKILGFEVGSGEPIAVELGDEVINDIALVDFQQGGAGASDRSVRDKLRETVSITDFGASSDATAAVNTAAIQAAMTYLMDRFDGADDLYAGGPGDPTDFSGRDRRTGQIRVPAGVFKVSDKVFSSLEHPRAPYVGFEFVGEHRRSSVLMLETGGVEAWFYDNSDEVERYQTMLFRGLGFRSDNYLYGNVARIFSEGAVKQFRFEHCEFDNLQKFMHTLGAANADLHKALFCYGLFYGDFLTLDNDQSVGHEFIGCDFGFYGNVVRVKQHGGGNVLFSGGSWDFLWHEDFSPAGGNFMFVHDADANIGEGNCLYTFKDLRVEMEAYKSTAGAPPFGLVKMVENAIAFPRVVFENINFVNGRTATINSAGEVTSTEFRRITAVQMWPGKYVEFRSGQLIKAFFYSFEGSRDSNAPPHGGIVRLADLQDGVDGELPAADTAKWSAHSRTTYGGSAGRLITEGLTDHNGGSSFVRKLNDADPRGPTNSFGHEPSCKLKRAYFKHTNNGWPAGANAGNDHFLDIPPGITDARFYVKKPASGAITDTYQLHLKADDRAGALIAATAESTSAQVKDEHIISVDHVDVSALTRISLCASGTATEFQEGGIAYMEYV